MIFIIIKIYLFNYITNCIRGGSIKEIIICTDLYTSSDQTVISGYNIGQLFNQKTILFHVNTISPQIEHIFHPPTIHTQYLYEPVWDKDIEITVLQRIGVQLNRLKLNKEDFKFESFEGLITEGIKYLGDKFNINFIVIGATHHRNMHRLFFNSFAEKTFFNLKKDVLLIKKSMHQVQHITHLLSWADDNANDLSIVSYWAKMWKAKVGLDCVVPIEFVGLNLEIFREGPSAREILLDQTSHYHEQAENRLIQARDKLRSNGIECDYSLKMILNKSPGKTLSEMIIQSQTDLVILRPEHYVFDRFVIGSTTFDLLRKVKANMYLINKGDEK